MENERPLVGVCVLIRQDDKFLVGKRLSKHGYGLYGCPGGHLEHMESFEDAATRELKEETDIDCKFFKFITAVNAIYPEENKHYVTIYMLAMKRNGEPKLMEPDKCEGWEWMKFDHPSEIFMPGINGFINQGWPRVLTHRLGV